MYTHMCVYVYISLPMCVYIYIYYHLCMHLSLSIYIYSCICIYTYHHIAADLKTAREARVVADAKCWCWPEEARKGSYYTILYHTIL